MAWVWTCATPEDGQDVPTADPPSRSPVWTVLVTECGGRVSHYVIEDDVTALLRGTNPRGLCGRTFIPAALVTPPGRVCDDCLRHLDRPGRRKRRRKRARHRRPSALFRVGGRDG